MTKEYSTCGEVFNYEEPEFDTGDTYYSGDKVEVKPSSLLYSAVTYMIDGMEEQLYERVGENGVGALYLSQEKKDELEKIIENFMDENVGISCYAVENIEEHVWIGG